MKLKAEIRKLKMTLSPCWAELKKDLKGVTFKSTMVEIIDVAKGIYKPAPTKQVWALAFLKEEATQKEVEALNGRSYGSIIEAQMALGSTNLPGIVYSLKEFSEALNDTYCEELHSYCWVAFITVATGGTK